MGQNDGTDQSSTIKNKKIEQKIKPVIGTIPSIPIPIPFANFGIGIDPQFKFQSWNWCHNSNSNSTELGGFQGIPMFVLKSVEKVEKRCEPGVTSVFLGLLVTPGWGPQWFISKVW